MSENTDDWKAPLAAIDTGLHPSERFRRILTAVFTASVGLAVGAFFSPYLQKVLEDFGAFGDVNSRAANVASLWAVVSKPEIAATIGFSLGVAAITAVIQILTRNDRLRGRASEPIRSLEELEQYFPHQEAVSLPRMIDPADIFHDPKSLFADAISLMTAKLSGAKDYGMPRIVLVTSSGPNEGKSTIATALAYSLTRRNHTTLLVDADLRNPTIHHYLGADNKEGLSNFLAGGAENLRIKRHSIDRVDFISAGPIPPNAAELLDSSRLNLFLETALQRYNTIIIDAPPLLRLADAIILAKHCDYVVFVARAALHPIHRINRSIRQLRVSRSNLMLALNHVRLRHSELGDYGYGYGYGYGYVNRAKSDGEPVSEIEEV